MKRMKKHQITRLFSNKEKMKKSLLNQFIVSSRTWLALTCLLIGNVLSAQPDCNLGLACNDEIQLSLEENCQATVTAFMVLETMDFLEEDYKVTLKDQRGNFLPSNVVSSEHVGMTLYAKVELIDCNNSCWGIIRIEDKLPPLVSNCEDVTINCDDSREPGVVIPEPIFEDSCDGVLDANYYDIVTDQLCQNQFAEIITRTWVASDNSGNTATCVQTISVNRYVIDDVVFPMDFDGDNVIQCGTVTDTLDNGIPSPDVTGYPTGIDCPNIQYLFDDLVFDICGNSKKALRRWSVFDWCTGRDTTHRQIIKLLDTLPPLCESAGEIIYETSIDPGKCTGSFKAPPPNVTEECSDYSYIVGYKPVDDSGDPFTEAIFYNTTVDENGDHILTNLPMDTLWLVYVITDICGNETECFNRLVVIDDESPTAICEGYTVVTLDNFGHGSLMAESLDDGSWDNCGIDRFEVKRDSTHCDGESEDLNFGEKVIFCCDDTEVDYIMVTLRVYDRFDNFNDCRVRVKVQDKIPPQLNCPDDVTVKCTDDIDNLSITGMATATDACEVEIDYDDNFDNLNACGVGYVIRTWSAEDQQGLISECTQRIDVETVTPFTENSIEWPEDILMNGCQALDADPEGDAGKPIVRDSECKDIAISYDDKMFYREDGKCIKILRTWRVTEWCTFNPDDPLYYYDNQLILLENYEAPEFLSACNNLKAKGSGCQGYIDLTATATDDCTPENELEYRWEIDVNNTGKVDHWDDGNDASGVYEAGTHKITFYAKDLCGNEGSCTYMFTIEDDEPPTPICLGELVWVLDSDGKATVWASDFDLKSTDRCSADDKLTFAFNESGSATSLDFDCFHVPNGIAAEIPLKMYVFDESGNFSYCNVTLVLQDSKNNNACFNTGNSANLGGRILNETFEGLDQVEVELENMSVYDMIMNKTDDEGQYAFSDINYYDTYHIVPNKNDDVINGVSTLDLVFIQQYILGMRDLDNPFKLIAADVNGNNKVSSSDLVDLRKVILGIYEEFPNNSSWRFIPADYEFEEDKNKWSFPEDVTVEELLISDENVDFVAIKTGDINGTATANSRSVKTRSSNYMTIKTDSETDSGITQITFSSEEINNLIGLQFTIDFAQDIDDFSIEGMSLNISSHHINTLRLEEGIISLAWNEIRPVNINDEPLFRILIEGEIDPSLISITSEMTAALGYDGQGVEYELILDNNLNEEVIEEIHLFQNQPNPFTDFTYIKVNAHQDMDMNLSFYDLSGRVLSSRKISLNSGTNMIEVNRSELNVAGVIYYQLKNQWFSETKKMIILD